MRTTKVLLIESSRTNGVSFAAPLMRKYDVLVARSGKQGLALGKETPPDVIVLNAASMRTSGDRISARLRAQFGELPIIHIRPEEITDGDVVADVLLAPPFTPRKLINRVERYVPALKAELIEVGPFSLNVAQQTLTTPWSEKKLTPKLVELMKLFMEQPETTLERKHIMQTIWKTDYMGDTRTLDVHIRWLRQVVEPKPRKPQYITTVRGVGYCFQVPDDDAAEGASEKTSSKQSGTASKDDKVTNKKKEIDATETTQNGNKNRSDAASEPHGADEKDEHSTATPEAADKAAANSASSKNQR